MLCSFRSLRAIKSPPLAACLCLAASVLISPAQQQTASLSDFTVRGSLIDSITKQPIARALVQLSGGDAVLTDPNGSFEFPDVPPGQQTLTVRRPGYITNQEQPGFQPSQNQISTFQVSIRADMAPLTLALTPEAIITGRIASPDSDPEDGIQISAYRKSIENGRPKWQPAGNASTNSEGVFRLASLTAGTYLLYGESPPPDSFIAAPDDTPTTGYPTIYYPGVTDASAAGTIALAPGEHKQADITLLRQTLYPVIIKATNAPPGNPFNVDLTDSGGRPTEAPTRLDFSQPVAHTHLPPGHYFVTARVFDVHTPNTSLFGRTEFTVTAAPAYIGITVTPLRSIPVIIHREFTPTFSMGPGRPGINLNLIDAGAEFSGGGNYAGGLEPVPGSNDDSSYQISSVTPGKYWVEAEAFQGYVSSITSGGVDLTHDILNISGGSSAPVEITLRNDTGSIDGTITNTQSPPDAELHHTFVYAIPLFGTSSQLPATSADSSGKFTFSNLAPGSYRVIASDTPLQIAYHSPEALAALSNKGQVVAVEPGSDAHVQLDITPPAEPTQ